MRAELGTYLHTKHLCLFTRLILLATLGGRNNPAMQVQVKLCQNSCFPVSRVQSWPFQLLSYEFGKSLTLSNHTRLWRSMGIFSVHCKAWFYFTGLFFLQVSNSSIDIKMYTQTFVTELFAVMEDLNVPQQGEAVWTRVRWDASCFRQTSGHTASPGNGWNQTHLEHHTAQMPEAAGRRRRRPRKEQTQGS